MPDIHRHITRKGVEKSEYWRNCHRKLHQWVLTKLIPMETGEIPDDWRTANVAPIFKRENKTALITCAKLMKHNMCHNVSIMLLTNILYLSATLWHWKNTISCISGSMVSDRKDQRKHNFWFSYMNCSRILIGRNKQTNIAILDFSKAFGKVTHRKLLFSTKIGALRCPRKCLKLDISIFFKPLAACSTSGRNFWHSTSDIWCASELNPLSKLGLYQWLTKWNFIWSASLCWRFHCLPYYFGSFRLSDTSGRFRQIIKLGKDLSNVI